MAHPKCDYLSAISASIWFLWSGRKSGESKKSPQSQNVNSTTHKPSPLQIWGLGFKSKPHYWEACALSSSRFPHVSLLDFHPPSVLEIPSYLHTVWIPKLLPFKAASFNVIKS